MTKAYVFLLFLVCAAAGAQPAWAEWLNLAKLAGNDAVAKSDVPDVGSLPTEKVARVSWLDKQTNRRQIVVVAAGAPQTLGGLQVEMKKCLPDYRGTLGQDVAWLQIGEAGNGRSAPWFSGWMINTYPEISTLDHPRYDVQLLGCGAKERQIAPRAAPVIVEEAGPAADTETPDDTSTSVEEKEDNGNDPFVVPGIPDKEAPAAPTAQPQADAAPVVEAKPAVQALPQAEPAAVAPQGGDDNATHPAEDLHKLMDGGVY